MTLRTSLETSILYLTCFLVEHHCHNRSTLLHIMTLQVISHFLAGEEPLSSRTLEVYNDVKAYILMKLQLSMEMIIDALREDLHPDFFYHSEVASGPTTTYHVLKDYMVLNDVTYTAHYFKRRVSYGLVNIIYTEKVNKNRAFMLLENPATSLFATVSTTVPTAAPTLASSSATYFDVDEMEPNTVNANTNKFKKDDRISRKIGKDVNEF